MKKNTGLTGGLVLLLMCIAASAAASEHDAIVEADRLFEQRGNPSQAKAALSHLQNATQEYPGSYGLHWRLARICFWLADGTQDTAIKRIIGKEGWDAGEMAISLDPDGIEGYYWSALTMGEHAKDMSVAEGLSKGLDGKFNDYLDKVLSMDESYGQGGALRARARYWYALPRVMRSYPKCLDYLERSNELVPGHPRTLLYMAEAYHVLGEHEKARQALEASLQASFHDSAERQRMLTWARNFQAELQ